MIDDEGGPPSVVADASPLIILAAIGRLDLIQRLFGDVAIPPSVWTEVVEAGGDRPGARELRSSSWIRVVRIRSENEVRDLRVRRRLDPGEADAIALALETKSALLADERRARAVAASLGLEVVGTLGILVEAQRRELVEDASERIEDAVRAGYRIKESVKSAAIAEIERIRSRKQVP